VILTKTKTKPVVQLTSFTTGIATSTPTTSTATTYASNATNRTQVIEIGLQLMLEQLGTTH
jgi:hypothetical protein